MRFQEKFRRHRQAADAGPPHPQGRGTQGMRDPKPQRPYSPTTLLYRQAELSRASRLQRGPAIRGTDTPLARPSPGIRQARDPFRNNRDRSIRLRGARKLRQYERVRCHRPAPPDCPRMGSGAARTSRARSRTKAVWSSEISWCPPVDHAQSKIGLARTRRSAKLNAQSADCDRCAPNGDPSMQD